MAKKAVKAGSATKKPAAKKSGAKKSTAKKTGVRKVQSVKSGGSNAGDAFIGLLQSPLVADLLAVAATSALAALAEHGFNSQGSGRQRTSKAVKEAGKAAATAIGRRLTSEYDEIRKASKKPADAAKA